MNIHIYVDTNIIIDFLCDRDSAAYRLLIDTIKCKYFIIISNVVLAELKYQGLENEAKNFIDLMNKNKKIKIYITTEEDKKEARELGKTHETHYNDALHKIAAEKENATYFVTKNIKDFECFETLIIKKPDVL